MSSHAKVIVFYGVKFDPDSEGAKSFRANEELTRLLWSDEPQKHPDGIELVQYGHPDFMGFGVALAGTVTKGESWNALPLPVVVPRIGTRERLLLKAFCYKYGLEQCSPEWWAVPYYG